MGLAARALDYLVKPVNGEELLSKIAALSRQPFMAKRGSLREFQAHPGDSAGRCRRQERGRFARGSGRQRLLAARFDGLRRNRSPAAANVGAVDETLVCRDHRTSAEACIRSLISLRFPGAGSDPQNASSRLLLVGTGMVTMLRCW